MHKKGQLSLILKGGPTLALIAAGVYFLSMHYSVGWDTAFAGWLLVILGIAYSLTWKFF